ncbi:uncharacterized protein TNCV_4352651 [Trichonephila clavipes]|nr:uncharacterized protein TNCV_4352651 [Trichonephila clavipes]
MEYILPQETPVLHPTHSGSQESPIADQIILGPGSNGPGSMIESRVYTNTYSRLVPIWGVAYWKRKHTGKTGDLHHLSNIKEVIPVKGVAAVAEWYRYQIVACFVTGSSPVPLKTRRVGQLCTLNLSRAETSSRWCGVVVRRGGASSCVVHVT